MADHDECPPSLLLAGEIHYSGGAEKHKGNSNYNPNKIGGIGPNGGDTGGDHLTVPDCTEE